MTNSCHATGAEDGCYSDWSLDLLVAKKVCEVPILRIFAACFSLSFSVK